MYFEWPLIYSYPILQYVPQQSFEVYVQENRLYSNYSALDQTEMPQVLLHITEVGRSAPNLAAERSSSDIVRKQQNNQNNENSIQIKSQQGDEMKRNKNSVYPKKNAQSNLINQIFSFLSSKSKSYYILLKILKNNQMKVAFYYELMKNLKSMTKKYINRFFIKKLIQIDSDHYINTYLKNSQSPVKIEVPELRKLFRMLINYYFNNVCSNILLTSTKLNRQSRKQHLRRKREVQSFLVYHVKLSNSKSQKTQI